MSLWGNSPINARILKKYVNENDKCIGFSIQLSRDNYRQAIDIDRDKFKELVYNGEIICYDVLITSDGRMVERHPIHVEYVKEQSDTKEAVDQALRVIKAYRNALIKNVEILKFGINTSVEAHGDASGSKLANFVIDEVIKLIENDKILAESVDKA